mmetsp:Transcript_56390/g.122779  ORF Transcript_56390/g.122779 Transcript_56390/m.122779 type:complete len:319 (+) Transcript_56390:1674-2630(+)
MIPNMDWIRGVSQDAMHTSLQGTVPLEAGLMQFVFIRIQRYYTRYELNAARLTYQWPAGHSIPEFGKYVEEGITGNLPSPTGRLKFTASQSRHWIEHGTVIMEELLQRKGAAYKSDPVWLRLLALVELTTSVLSDSFLVRALDDSRPDAKTRLDDLQLRHHTAFVAVPEYSGCLKPKHMMSANYLVDVLNTGPPLRTWCMTFEAMLQLLKGIACNSNYKDVLKRMATLWSVRTGLELLHEKLTHWSESWITKKEARSHWSTIRMGQRTPLARTPTASTWTSQARFWQGSFSRNDLLTHAVLTLFAITVPPSATTAGQQ